MINAWSLAAEVLNGTLDENFPIKKKKMSKDENYYESLSEGKDEGVVNVPGDINLDQDINIKTTSDKEVFNVSYDGLKQEHSDYWYDYTRNDPNRENPFTDPVDRARADRVVGKAEELNINIPSEFNYAASVDRLVDDMPSAFTTLSDNDDQIAHHISGPSDDDLFASMDGVELPRPGIEVDCPRKYKEDDAIKALQDYISTTYNGHYTSKQNNVQTLDLIESVGDAEAFCRSNAIKYLSRYDKKGQAKRDILKALHYSLLLYHFSGQLNETTTRGYETF